MVLPSLKIIDDYYSMVKPLEENWLNSEGAFV